MGLHLTPLLVSAIALSLTFLGRQTIGQTLAEVTAQTGDRTDAVRQAVVGGAARNVILFLGDGMGDSEITLARNYGVGDRLQNQQRSDRNHRRNRSQLKNSSVCCAPRIRH